MKLKSQPARPPSKPPPAPMPPPIKPITGPAPAYTSTTPDFIPSPLTGWVGFAGFLLGVVYLNKFGPVFQLARYWEGLLIMAFTAGPMIVCDSILLRRRRRGDEPIEGITRQRDYSIGRTVIKTIGLFGTIALLAFLYWVFPEYNASYTPEPDKGFYSNFFILCYKGGPWALLICPIYIYLVDARMKDPQDGYWHFGRLLLLDFKGIDWPKIWNHLRTWAVKGYFLPLMFVFLCDNLPGLYWRVDQANALKQLFTSYNYGEGAFLTLHDWMHNLLFTIDLAFVSCGYLLTLRWVQSHVRSAEPTGLGWTAALMCYQPFWNFIGDFYLGYWSDIDWTHLQWLTSSPARYYIWGTGILFFESIFVWSSISFGLRFSNLTHRGIVTKGSYYFTKHPAYISKICAFLLISAPWIDSRGTAQEIRNCLMLAGLAFLYWIRAKTEERHLSSIDPAYSIYAEEIRQRHRRWLRLQFGASKKKTESEGSI